MIGITSIMLALSACLVMRSDNTESTSTT
jgi:hypothetical protein